MNDVKNNPFDLNNDSAYQAWKDKKLQDAPSELNDLVVEVKDPRSISDVEHAEILARVKKCNMAAYVSGIDDLEGTDIPLAVGRRFGCINIDRNRGAEDDGVTAITTQEDDYHSHYIPYTTKEIHWHTDGYYNRLDLQNRALLLHFVRPAMEGGENAVMDHEMAYLLMRDENPDYIRALMREDAMQIPANVVDGEELRPDRIGPVFMQMADGKLHMRYTMRKRNVVWNEDPVVQEAVAWLEKLLKSNSEHIFRVTMQSGWGVVSNNVLHDRSGFKDDEDSSKKRLMYRARYYDRVFDS